MTMKKVVLFFLICLPSLMSYSQTAEDSIVKQNSIKELFQIMQQDSMMEKMFSKMIPSMMNQMKSQLNLTDSITNVRFNELTISVSQAVKEITKKMLEEDMVVLYDKYFSQNEINDFITFYKSPSGQKFIFVTQDISKDMMMIVQKYMPEVQKAIRGKVEEMKNSVTK